MTNTLVNRISQYQSYADTEPVSFSDRFWSESRDVIFIEAKYDAEHRNEAKDWLMLARLLVAQLTFANRVSSLEKQVESIRQRETFKPLCVPISTFAPEPYEIIKDFSVVVQPEEDSFVATLFDANISASGETQEEAVANVKDLIIMFFEGIENQADSDLGPAMIRQKHALLSLIRRK